MSLQNYHDYGKSDKYVCGEIYNRYIHVFVYASPMHTSPHQGKERYLISCDVLLQPTQFIAGKNIQI